LIDCEELFRGTIDGASLYPREILKSALRHNAAALVMVHNHPSNSAEFSRADEQITHRVKAALELVDIQLIDHLLGGFRCVTGDEYFAEFTLFYSSFCVELLNHFYGDTFWSLRANGAGAVLPMPFDFMPSVSPSRRLRCSRACARSSPRRVACGQPMTAALRWPSSGLGQYRPIKTGDVTCRIKLFFFTAPTALPDLHRMRK
jgi:hypothetical protein